MAAPRVLFIGGTGVISAACARQAVEAGFDLSVMKSSATISNSAAVAGLTPSGPGAQGAWRGNA
ncbi:MAG TPA: hypothetical protein VGA04_32980 [Streptosporangiaceae bacterium]